MKIIKYMLLSLLPLSLACSESGNSSVPEFPIDPDGTVIYTVQPGGGTVHADLFDNAIKVDDTLSMSGDNMRFASKGASMGVGYVRDIPREGWRRGSGRMRAGEAYVAAEISNDGTTFAALYVDAIDTLGRVRLKVLSPIYGRLDTFAVIPRRIVVDAEACDTTVYIVHPATYTAALSNGTWAKLTPNVSFMHLHFDENNTGKERCDTLHLSNELFPTLRIPILQGR